MSFPTATPEEVQKLKRIVTGASGKIIRRERPVPETPNPAEHKRPANEPGEAPNNSPREKFPNVVKDTAEGTNYLSAEVVDGVPIPFDNPVQMLLVIDPEASLHKWQFETLMMLAGYITPGNYRDKVKITDSSPLRLAMAAANGSGKDRFILAGFNTWFALSAVQNFAVITSSSFDQVKYQTEPHIRKLADSVNAKFGRTFYSTQFHHIIKRYGSQIKLFATNDAGRAEGFHPYGKGAMALNVNEAKSLDPDIFAAMERCSGYSHWIEISSPAGCSGHFYDSAKLATRYPSPLRLNEFYFRKITQYDCPHIPQAHIDNLEKRYGRDSALFKSSVLAEFSDAETDNLIKAESIDICINATIPLVGEDIGIGLDLAAGGDENGCFVRKGNKIIHKFFFVQKDTTLTADLIDTQLTTWKSQPYMFNADDGGVGHAIIDMLRKKGWIIQRRNNQSAPHNRREFSNLGAQMWYHVKRLIELKQIHIPHEIPKLVYQLSNRYHLGLDQTQGKIALEPKSIARAKGHASPDRADAFVLCFYGYNPNAATYNPKAQSDAVKRYSPSELNDLLRRNGSFSESLMPSGRYTILTGNQI